MKDILMGLARHVGGYVGGLLAAKGYIESSQTEIVIGIVVGVAAIGFSIWDKRKRAKETTNA